MSPRKKTPGNLPTTFDSGIVVVVSLTAGHRVVIPQSVRQSVSWLRSAKTSIDCTIRWMGTVPGLQVQPTELATGVELQSDGPALTASSETDLSRREALRLNACQWNLTLERHGETFRFIVPEPVRRIGLLPGYVPDAKGSIVLFGCGETLELWNAEDWKNYLRRLSGAERGLGH